MNDPMKCHTCDKADTCKNPPDSECGGDIQAYLDAVRRWFSDKFLEDES